jgi:hypothetical protein
MLRRTPPLLFLPPGAAPPRPSFPPRGASKPDPPVPVHAQASSTTTLLETELLLSSRERMTLGVRVIFWFISHTMSCQPKGLGLHIYSWPMQPSICQDAVIICCPLRRCPSNHHAKDHKDQQYKTYSIILSLSFGHHLVGELDHPDPGATINKLEPPKGLGEQIRKLSLVLM